MLLHNARLRFHVGRHRLLERLLGLSRIQWISIEFKPVDCALIGLRFQDLGGPRSPVSLKLFGLIVLGSLLFGTFGGDFAVLLSFTNRIFQLPLGIRVARRHGRIGRRCGLVSSFGCLLLAGWLLGCRLLGCWLASPRRLSFESI